MREPPPLQAPVWRSADARNVSNFLRPHQVAAGVYSSITLVLETRGKQFRWAAGRKGQPEFIVTALWRSERSGGVRRQGADSAENRHIDGRASSARLAELGPTAPQFRIKSRAFLLKGSAIAQVPKKLGRDAKSEYLPS